MTSNSSLVSVLMPVFNGIETIELAIKSLLLQTYENWELIIVNDGSTDGTKLYLDNLILTDARFKVIHLAKNMGRGYARNQCLENAKGEFVAFLDSDDLCMPTKLQKQVEFLENNQEISLVGCGVGILDDLSQVNYVRGNKNEVFVHVNYQNLNFVAPSVMFKRFLDPNLRYNQKLDIMEDVDFFNRYLLNRKYTNISEVLYIYSEIGLISKSKLLKYSLHTVKYYWIFLKTDFKLLSKFFLSIINLLSKLILVPILGVDFFLIRRSRNIESNVKLDLENFVKLIKVKD